MNEWDVLPPIGGDDRSRKHDRVKCSRKCGIVEDGRYEEIGILHEIN